MTNDSTPRRDFLGQIAASAMVLAGAACAAPAAQAPTPGPTPAGTSPGGSQATQWDDTWFARLSAKHKAVFDSPEIEDGLALANASGYIRGMHDAIGADERDVQTVVVVRHHGVVMAFNDAMWQKYAIGK